MNAIQTNAHHLLRYLAAAVVINKRRRNMLKDLIRVIQQESYTYSDPITEFLECLFVRYDFEGAQVSARAFRASPATFSRFPRPLSGPRAALPGVVPAVTTNKLPLLTWCEEKLARNRILQRRAQRSLMARASFSVSNDCLACQLRQ